MRKVACFLLTAIACLGSAMLVTAAETWRWKDANGVIHYSDRPVPGAERVSVIAPKPSSSPPQQTGVDPAAAPTPRASQPAVVPYSRCMITSPGSEETFNAVTSVTVGVLLQPELQEGHRIEVLLDGNIVPDWPPDALSHPVNDLLRGAHTLGVRVLNAEGGAVCAGPALAFHIRLPTVKPQVQHR